MQNIIKSYLWFLGLAHRFSSPMKLVIRLWMARVFFVSGMLKVSDWQTTINLFTYEHPVPFLSPYVAAVMGTTFELLCPVALAVGFLTRPATLPLLVMTAVIQFTYLDHIQHYYWALLLGMILACGPGHWSVDYWLSRKIPALNKKF